MVHEDPDELGYFTAPLSRSKAQGDLGDLFEPGRHERAAAVPGTGYQGLHLYDLIPYPAQKAMVKAACCPEDSAIAEQYRKQAGYQWRIDPGWG